MKNFKMALFLTCSMAVCLVQADESKVTLEQGNIHTLASSKSLADEITKLKSKEALLEAILKNSEFIQLRDGSSIDFRDLESLAPSKALKGLNRSFMAREGGTGHGG